MKSFIILICLVLVILTSGIGVGSEHVIVSHDGMGNFSSISQAIIQAPNNSVKPFVIHIRSGKYQENITVPAYKTNIHLIGDGIDSTFITCNHSVGDHWDTDGSATLVVLGEGFMARDLTIENTAGPEKYQAVALSVSADMSCFYKCAFKGYQDTLNATTERQFFRECDIYGTIDFIFGDSTGVFQKCNIYVRKPMKGQHNVCMAHGRHSATEKTGFSIHRSNITLSPEVDRETFRVPTFLGRPWKTYSRTVIMHSYIDGVFNKEGWEKWSKIASISNLYYGEYMNFGPRANTNHRVHWSTYHIMTQSEAFSFTVSELIDGKAWIRVPFNPYL